jgi:hypothetical protein
LLRSARNDERFHNCRVVSDAICAYHLLQVVTQLGVPPIPFDTLHRLGEQRHHLNASIVLVCHVEAGGVGE